MSSKVSIELDESNLLLPAVIDLRAQAEPDKLFCAFLNSADVQDGLVRVSYSDYTNAINRCSWWLEGKLGKGDGLSLKTIGYFGPPDIRQTIVALAVSKINHKVKDYNKYNSVVAKIFHRLCCYLHETPPKEYSDYLTCVTVILFLLPKISRFLAPL
jgi:hypothetical protein